LVVGGFDAPLSAEVYYPSSNNFVSLGATIDTRENHTATLLDNGKVLIAGGASTTGASLPGATNGSAEIYDPDALGGTGMFMAVSDPMGSPRMWHTATKLQDGRVLIAGGRSQQGGPMGTVVTDTADIYDPSTGQFTPTVGTMTVPRERHTATLLPNGSVLIVGGDNDDPNVHSSAEIFNPLNNMFWPLASMSLPRNYHSATLLGDGSLVLIAGGNGPLAEVYDLNTLTFRTTGDMWRIRDGHTAVLLPDPGDDGILGTPDDGPGRVLLVGGFGTGPGGGGEENTVEIYHAVKW
jgi:hypothetical protein